MVSNMIHYLKGDATRPIDTGGPRFIIHVCNDRGGWGRGFVLALSKRWPEPEKEYRRWYRDGSDLFGGTFQLGAVQPVPVQGDPPLSVINMIAQKGYGKGNLSQHQATGGNETPPIRYEALETCLQEVGALVQSGSARNPSIHMPKIGTGLAQGDWGVIEPIIQRALAGLSVFVYEYDP